MPQRAKILANLFLVYISWGSVYIGFKFVLEVLPPFLAVGSRMTLAGLLLCAWLRLAGRWQRPGPGDTRAIFALAFFLVFVASGFLGKGQDYVPSGVAAVVTGTTPISMLLGAWLFAHEPRPGLAQCLGLAGGLGGLSLLAFARGGDASLGIGTLWLLAATFGWVAGSLAARHMPRTTGLPHMQECGLILLAGGLECLAGAAVFGEFSRLRLQNLDATVILAFAWMVLGGSIIAYSSYFWLLRHSTTAVAVSYEYVVPIIGVFLGWWLGGESLNPQVLGACALIAGSVFFVLWGQAAKPEPGQP